MLREHKNREGLSINGSVQPLLTLFADWRCTGRNRNRNENERDKAHKPRCTWWVTASSRRTPQKPTDSCFEFAAVGSRGKFWNRRKFRELGECPRVVHGFAREPDRNIIAAILALSADVSGKQPDRRVIEQERFDHALTQVHNIIIPTYMSQLVSKHRDKLFPRKSCNGSRWQQHHWLQPADCCRHGHQSGLKDANDTSQSQAFAQYVEQTLNVLIDRLQSKPRNPDDLEPRQEQPNRQQRRTDKPNDRNPRCETRDAL